MSVDHYLSSEGRGSVVSFDDHAGYGIVRDEVSALDYPFHCTAIADGTRTISPGAAVVFVIAAGRLGTWEAFEVAGAAAPS